MLYHNIKLKDSEFTYLEYINKFVECFNKTSILNKLRHHNGMLTLNGEHHIDIAGALSMDNLSSCDLKLFINRCVKNLLEKENSKSTHPLLNPKSKHYDQPDGREGIELLEQMFTTEQLKSWALITAMKYRLRIGRKDDGEKELLKIKTYEDYYKYLNKKG